MLKKLKKGEGKMKKINMKDINIQAGQNIRWLRQKAGLTQEQLAEHLDKSYKTICRWEGGALPPRKSLSALAQLFNVTIDSILNEDLTCPQPQEYKVNYQRLYEDKQLSVLLMVVVIMVLVRLPLYFVDIACYYGALRTIYVIMLSILCLGIMSIIIILYEIEKFAKLEINGNNPYHDSTVDWRLLLIPYPTKSK